MTETRTNRRRHPRVRGRDLSAHLETPAGRSAAVLENLSLGGVFVRTDQLQDAGTEVTVELLGPGWRKALKLEARVTSRVDAPGQPTGMGLQFVSVDDEKFDRLRKLIVELGATEKTGAADARRERSGREHQPGAQWKHVELVEQAIAGALKESTATRSTAAAAGSVYEPSLPKQPRGPADPTPGELKTVLLELSEARRQIARRDEEIQLLRIELDALRDTLARAGGPKPAP